jgi:hypothetical protein
MASKLAGEGSSELRDVVKPLVFFFSDTLHFLLFDMCLADRHEETGQHVTSR